MEHKITADIVDYLGKYDNGVLVLLTIGYNNESYTEGTLFYSNQMLVLTVDETVEESIESPIELWEGYRELLESILKRVVPYDDIINQINDIEIPSYKEEESTEGEEIEDSDIRKEE